MLILWSLSRLAVMDSDTELVALIHSPPSLKRSSGQGAEIKDFGDNGGVVPVRVEDVAPAVASGYSDFGWIVVFGP